MISTTSDTHAVASASARRAAASTPRSSSSSSPTASGSVAVMRSLVLPSGAAGGSDGAQSCGRRAGQHVRPRHPGAGSIQRTARCAWNDSDGCASDSPTTAASAALRAERFIRGPGPSVFPALSRALLCGSTSPLAKFGDGRPIPQASKVCTMAEPYEAEAGEGGAERRRRRARRGLAGVVVLAVLSMMPAGAHGRLFGEAAGSLRRDGTLPRPPVQARGAARGSPAFQLVPSLHPRVQSLLQGASAPLRPAASVRHPARISLAPPARRSVPAALCLPSSPGVADAPWLSPVLPCMMCLRPAAPPMSWP
jgi:hypothetical protein